MNVKSTLRKGVGIGLLACSLAVVNPVVTTPVIYASSIDNDLGFSKASSGGSNSSNQSASNLFDNGNVSQEDINVGNYIKNQRGMSTEQLNKASAVVSPLTNVIGYLIGAVIVIIMTGIFFVTALDLLYISIPFVRPLLYAPGTDGTGAMTGGRMPGYGGYGGGYGGYGGMPQQGGRVRKTQWVSDEAVQCAAMLGGSSGTEGMGMMSRVGQPPQQQMSKGSVIKSYFIKRALFMVLLAVCIVVLTSSVLLGTGVNIANWGIKILDSLNKVMSIG